MKTNHILRILAVVAVSTAISHAKLQTFDFKDPKGVNNVQFKLDAPLESITGTATGISGTVDFDPSEPEKTRGQIVLKAASLTVGNPVMAEHLQGEQWIDVAKFPSLVFEAQGAKNVRSQGNQIHADISGKLTVRGVTRDITVPVSFTYLADKLGARVNDPKVKGDLLVLRANFEIKRSDFGIKPGEMTDKVADTIHLSLSIAGAAPHQT